MVNFGQKKARLSPCWKSWRVQDPVDFIKNRGGELIRATGSHPPKIRYARRPLSAELIVKYIKHSRTLLSHEF